MARWSRALAAVLLTGIAASLGLAWEQEAAPPKKATVDDLAWLVGSWRSEAHGETFDEHWLPAAGGTMAAVSRSAMGGKTGMYELGAIEPGEGGVPVLRIRHFGAGLVPWKSEAAGTPSWPLVSTGKEEAVFEDPAREFPRRITYRIEGKDTLLARLDPAEGSTREVIEIRMRRVK